MTWLPGPGADGDAPSGPVASVTRWGQPVPLPRRARALAGQPPLSGRRAHVMNRNNATLDL